jgi:hypothetical protein
MMEAMGCCRSVEAMRRGSVSEILDEGVTGFIVDNEEAAARAATRPVILASCANPRSLRGQIYVPPLGAG